MWSRRPVFGGSRTLGLPKLPSPRSTVWVKHADDSCPNSDPTEAASIRSRYCTIAVVAFCLSLSAGPPAWASAVSATRLTVRLAEKHLTPETLAAVKALLDDGETIADASLWADQHTREICGSVPWHYVNVPIDEPRYDSKFCPKGVCVVSKLAEFRAILRDKTKPREERQKALRFVLHLVGDLHQPLHVGNNHDRRGNSTQVRFFQRGSNLHAVWDTGLIGPGGKSEKAWLELLDEMAGDKNREAWRRVTVEDWANESLATAKEAYLIPETRERIRSGDGLGEDYVEWNLPTARE